MKRYGHLWDSLTSFSNLLEAAQNSARRKRTNPAVLAFHHRLESNLFELQKDLREESYEPGGYREFFVYEPKKRKISAAPYRDRVVHHALTQILGPIFERTFIHDSYACRTGKGTHAAVRRARQFMRQSRYVLKADIQKFFPSLDHELLFEKVARKIKDPLVLRLVHKLIASSNPQEGSIVWFPGDDLFTPFERRRGIPIGNQTSQFFANVFLDGLDHFVKDHLGVKCYVRYVDDFVLFGQEKLRLHGLRDRIGEYLVSQRLVLHPRKSTIFPVQQGMAFLGYRVFPTHCRLPKSNVIRFMRRMQRLRDRYGAGKIPAITIRQSLMSWLGHAKQARTTGLVDCLLAKLGFQRGMAE